MLRYVLGDEDFFNGIRLYLARFTDSSATTEQFQAVMEEVSGRDLNTFFQQWIYGEYSPRYRFSWTDNPSTGDDDLRVVLLRIDQIQINTGLFEMPLDVRIVSDLGTYNYRIENALQTEYYNFSVPGHTVTNLQLDPDDWVLNTSIGFGEVAVEDPLPPASLRLSSYPNPFNPTTNIEFELGGDDFVRLEIYDLAGRRVREMLAEPRLAGRHAVVWDGRGDDRRNLPSGTYIARLSTGDAVRNLKVSLAR
jgi:aminopeptidase N